ncbi:MAG: polyphenol oxidase family protein [Actinobacteria bacterium]|nr:polyphenol oxidase family protein [Actinomycetota bacterium]
MQPVVRFTDATDGSFALGEPATALDARRRAVTDHPVSWLSQVHGSQVVVVGTPGEGAGVEADALVTAAPGAALCVITADCAPVVLTTRDAVAAVHAGWRGLAAGVITATVAAVTAITDAPITAWLGPCIRARCYEFGADDLAVVNRALGVDVSGRTSWGAPALDVSAAVRASLASCGVTDVVDSGVCTACSPVHHSHRARADAGRQGAFVWLEP